jgi:hypothetical protein
MKIIIIITIVINFSICGFAQIYEEKLMSIHTDFYSQNNLSAYSCGMGLTGIAGNNDISGITLNPASYDIKNKYEARFEFAHKNKVNYLGFDEYHYMQIHPAVGLFLGYKISNKFQTGFSYRNDNSYVEHISKNYFLSYYTYTLTIPFVYRAKIISAGFNLNYILYEGNFVSPQHHPTDTIVDFKKTFGRFVPDFGIQINPIPEITIGLTYTPGFSKTIVKEWNSVGSGLPNDTTATNYPSKFGCGIQVRILENLIKIEADYRFENTSKTFSLDYRNNYYFGANFLVTKNWELRTGFFTQIFGHRLNQITVDKFENYDQYFITFGTGYKYKGFEIDLSFMNSTLLSDSEEAHSKFNCGIGYCF